MHLAREAKDAKVVDVEVQITECQIDEECGVKSKDPKVIDFAMASESK